MRCELCDCGVSGRWGFVGLYERGGVRGRRDHRVLPTRFLRRSTPTRWLVPRTGSAVGAGTFTGLVFTRTPQGTGRHFFGSIDTGIRCITQPCPSGARIEGRYSVTAGNLTISHPDRPSAKEYSCSVGTGPRLSGDSLTLIRYGRVAARLQRVRSYCQSPDDCQEQGLPVYRCAGGSFQCEANACQFRCDQGRGPKAESAVESLASRVKQA